MSNATFLALMFALPALADWRSGYQQGERLLQEGRIEQAVTELKRSLAEAGPGAEERGVVLDALGRAEYRAGHYRAAKRYLDGSVKLWPVGSRERAVALYNLGHVHLDLQEDARAEEVLSQALEILGGEAAAWHCLGQAQVRRGRRDRAEESYRKALSLADRAARPAISSDLADLLVSRLMYAKAAELLREAIAQAAPGQARARMMSNLGSLQWNWREKDQAAAQFRLALAEMEAAVGPSHPDVAKILDAYQEVLRKTGKKAEAVAMRERASAIRSSFAGQTNDRLDSVDWRDLRR